MMIKFKKILKHILVALIVANTIFLIYYLSVSTRNVLYMDYWRLARRIIPLACEGGMSFSKLWITDGGAQRNPLLLGLFYLNIKYLNLNASVPIYMGAITISIFLFLFYQIYIKKVYKIDDSYKQFVVFVPIILCSFCLNQWEIMETQFSFPFYIRILIYTLIIYLVDYAIKSENRYYMIYASIMMPIATWMLSQLYFMAIVLAVLFVLLIICIVDKNKRKTCIGYTCLWIITNGIGITVYFYDLETASAGGNLRAFLESIINGKAFLSFFYLLNSSILQTKTMYWTNNILIISVGIVLSTLVCSCLVLYCKNKMYLVSYSPILFIGYGIFSIGSIMYGRMFEFDIANLASSRYVVDTTMLWIGCLSIWGYSWSQSRSKIVLHIIIFISFCYIICDYDVFMQREYKAAYKEGIVSMCLQIEDYADEDLGVMLADSPDTVRDICSLMEQYNLNVFYYK